MNVKAEEELQYSLLLLIIVVVLAIIGKKVSVSDEQEKTTTITKKGVLAACEKREGIRATSLLAFHCCGAVHTNRKAEQQSQPVVSPGTY